MDKVYFDNNGKKSSAYVIDDNSTILVTADDKYDYVVAKPYNRNLTYAFQNSLYKTPIQGLCQICGFPVPRKHLTMKVEKSEVRYFVVRNTNEGLSMWLTISEYGQCLIEDCDPVTLNIDWSQTDDKNLEQ